MKDTYVNEDYINDLNFKLSKNQNLTKTEFLYVDDDSYSSSNYLKPRFGSNISSSTTNSTTPIVKNSKNKPIYEFTPLNTKKTYTPSPPPIKSAKFTQYKPTFNDTTQTDV
jgi:hypothetical protein